MNLKEAHEWLKQNKYILEFQGNIYVTSKYIRDIRKASTSVMVGNTGLAIATNIESTKDRFKRFIAEAEVPYRIDDGKGRQYTANAYSIKAEKIFNKAIDNGVNYKVLVACTKLYYRSTGYKQKIGNYFEQGTWEAEYDEFMKKLSQGNIVKHIKDNTDNNNTNMRLK